MNDRNQTDLNRIIQNGYSLDIGTCISRAWDILQQNLGGFVLFTLMIALIAFAIFLIAIGFFITIIGIPIGILILLLMFPLVLSPLAAGHVMVAFKLMKQQSVTFSDFFNGFKNSYFLPIFLSALVVGLFTTLCGVPGQVLSYLNLAATLAATIASDAATSSPSEIPGTNLGLTAASYALSIIGSIIGAIITLFYSLAVPFIVERKMAFWPAMEASRKVVAKRWFTWILLALALAVINLAGSLLCGLGLLVTSPLTACAVAAAYEQTVGLSGMENAIV